MSAKLPGGGVQRTADINIGCHQVGKIDGILNELYFACLNELLSWKIESLYITDKCPCLNDPSLSYGNVTLRITVGVMEPLLETS